MCNKVLKIGRLHGFIRLRILLYSYRDKVIYSRRDKMIPYYYTISLFQVTVTSWFKGNMLQILFRFKLRVLFYASCNVEDFLYLEMIYCFLLTYFFNCENISGHLILSTLKWENNLTLPSCKTISHEYKSKVSNKSVFFLNLKETNKWIMCKLEYISTVYSFIKISQRLKHYF